LGLPTTKSIRSTYWGPPLLESQYAVFHFDVETMSMRDAKGDYLTSENDAPLVFDTLAAAEIYCRREIAAIPALGCRIYDRDGQLVRTFSDDRVYDRHHGLPAAKRDVVYGTACLIAGFGGVGLDAWLHWRLIFGVVLGIRFLWVGTVRMMDGITGWRAARPAR
jgi:hypothetical protein